MTMMRKNRLTLSTALTALLSAFALSSSWSSSSTTLLVSASVAERRKPQPQPQHEQPHPHQGIVPPFQTSQPHDIQLDQSALQLLSKGKPYKTEFSQPTSTGDKSSRNNSNEVARTMLVQDVKAPVDTVLDRILDFNMYNRMVPNTLESEVYKREQSTAAAAPAYGGGAGAAAERLWVRLKAGVPGFTIQFFTNVLYEPSKKTVTWTLDYSKRSDVHDSVGYWHVQPHPENPSQWSRVYYATELSLFSWVPKMIANTITHSALSDAVCWVKKHSEKAVKQQQQQQLGSTLTTGSDMSTSTPPSSRNNGLTWLGSRLFSHRRKSPTSVAVHAAL